MFANMETEAQRRYLDEMMWEIDQRARWKYARKKAVAEGHAEGLAEGLAEAMEKTAKAMKAKNYDISEIIAITGLTEDQIASL